MIGTVILSLYNNKKKRFQPVKKGQKKTTKNKKKENTLNTKLLALLIALFEKCPLQIRIT